MTTPISPTGATVAPIASMSSGSADNTQLSSKAFLQLLVAQLQYQDPSKPVDTSSFMNETATLTQVQSMEANAQVSTQMLSVSYLAADGTTKTGLVSAATISTANPTLKIGTADVSLSQIQQVLSASSTAPVTS
jgi:flagellar basal-body rod modification protein FlgD